MATNGEPGVPSLGNRVPAAHPGATLVGWVTFSGVIRYTDRAAWAAAEPRHLVPDDDGPYGWKDGAQHLVAESFSRYSYVSQLASAEPCHLVAQDNGQPYGWKDGAQYI